MHPYFTLFGKSFPAYGVLCAIGVVFALVFGIIRARRAGLCPYRTIILFTFSLALGLSGAVFTHLIVTYSPAEIFSMLKSGEFFSLYQPGFVFYGGFIFGLIGAYASSRLFGFTLSRYAPALLPALPFAHAFGRVGCFLAGCCYGIHCTWGFVHPDGVSRFPVQLSEAFLLAFIMLALLKNEKNRRMSTLRLYVLLYAPVRFFLEFLRGDEIRGIFLLSTSQWISLILFALALLPVKSPRKG